MVKYKKLWSPQGSRKNTFPGLGVDPSRLAALLVLSIPKSMRSPRALPDRCLSTQTEEGILARTLRGDETFLYCVRSLSEISDRDEGVLV